MIKVYESGQAAERDSKALAEEGWEPVSVTDFRRRSGVLRGLLLGPANLWWHPRPQIIVAYRRTGIFSVPSASTVFYPDPTPAPEAVDSEAVEPDE